MADKKLEIIQNFLAEKFRYQVDTYMRLMFFLQRESNEFQGNTPVRNKLYHLIKTSNDAMIEEYLKNVVKDTRTASNDDVYKKVLHDMYMGYNTARAQSPLSQNLLDEIRTQAISHVDKSMKDRKTYVALLSHMTTSLSFIRNDEIPVVIEALGRSTFSKSLVPLVKTSGSLVLSAGKQVAIVSLIAVQLGWEAIKNIRLWWKGEISGKFCAKKITDAIGSILGGAAGVTGGAAAGSSFGPVGSVIGGIIGGIAGSITGESLTKKLTEWMFDLPKTAALEAAYNFLGVHHRADNSDCNKAYRRMALQCHPDRPEGTDEKWLKLQISFQVIKEARGQSF